MEMDKDKGLAWQSIYWMGVNVDIENHIKIALYVLTFRKSN